MELINLAIGRVVNFLIVFVAVLAVEFVFLDGNFDKGVFWALYLALETVLLTAYFITREPTRRSYGTGIVGGTPLNPDGTPPAHIVAAWEAEGRRAAAEAQDA